MLQQEKEFKAWGLSKLAIRNIVVAFIAFVIADNGMLRYDVANKQKEILVLNAKIEDCNAESTKLVERLKNETIGYIVGLERKQDSSIISNSSIINENQSIINKTKSQKR